MIQPYDIVVLGAGESGTGAAVLARTKGLRVFVSDMGTIKPQYKSILSQYDIGYEEGKHTENLIFNANEIVKSPGIPDTAPLVVSLNAKGTPVISEIEFAARYTDAFKIAITGSNGKTTTTLLCHYILKTAGLNAGLAGNVGTSFAMQVACHKYDLYVLEISSFQLDGMFRFKADMAVILNITPDHLDRYGHSFEAYAASKFRITQNQTPNDVLIYCLDDPTITNMLAGKHILSRRIPFSIKQPVAGEGAYLIENEIIINTQNDYIRMTIEELALQGRHNIYNSMAAGIIASQLGIRKETLRQCLRDFRNVEHRLEFVSNVHGIEFINDSKATNINSAWFALESMTKPVVWIAGGLDKGNDYRELYDLVKIKVKAIVCLGVDNRAILETFGGMGIPIIETRSAESAVQTAYHLAESGDVVLLSPACASFDLFENFEDRGNQFKQAVKKL